ncbi:MULTISPECIES: type IVB secretion system protein IcmH/DotU [unclassified Psychrobacter]|uniref:type IVB secretion system protein IcmH/DotU n=1 Tax=unclassified Psychrobacter TaxID=196806 RepID=UPI0018F52571|nr:MULTISPECIES: type IVB secretion system protein IcmH/DotU [unclassified Psychrobacter]
MSTNTTANSRPSLLDSGEVASSISMEGLEKRLGSRSLIDIMYDGFYLVFLLRNYYFSQNPSDFRQKIYGFLDKFEVDARKKGFMSEDVHEAKYAYCALVDETIMTSQEADFQMLKDAWELHPLQLDLFGSQIAGNEFFDRLDSLREQGEKRLPALEVYHYAMLLGFQGKYRLEASEKIRYLIARLGDEIEHLRGNKHEFAPFWAIPDQIKHTLTRQTPLWMIIAAIAFLLTSIFGIMYYFTNHNTDSQLTAYNQVIQENKEQAHISIFLP